MKHVLAKLRQVSSFNMDIYIISERNKISETSNMSPSTTDSFCLITSDLV